MAWPKPDYLKSLERAGAVPQVLRPERDPLPDALDACDGVLLTGGADVDPDRYGEPERHATVEIDPDRDEYELALTRYALDRDLPLLAICRGVQLLNVARGGTLVQDIPTGVPTALVHRRPRPPRVKRAPAHEVDLTPGTCLAALLRDAATNGRVLVNSRHHQAIRDVAPEFVIAASAPDGIVEAIEKPGARFCLGVQWHPENYWRSGEFSELFEGLARAARERQRFRLAVER